MHGCKRWKCPLYTDLTGQLELEAVDTDGAMLQVATSAGFKNFPGFALKLLYCKLPLS